MEIIEMNSESDNEPMESIHLTVGWSQKKLYKTCCLEL